MRWTRSGHGYALPTLLWGEIALVAARQERMVAGVRSLR